MPTKPVKISKKLRTSKTISELAGSWKMDDKEASELLARINNGWNL